MASPPGQTQRSARALPVRMIKQQEARHKVRVLDSNARQSYTFRPLSDAFWISLWPVEAPGRLDWRTDGFEQRRTERVVEKGSPHSSASCRETGSLASQLPANAETALGHRAPAIPQLHGTD